MYLIEFEDTLHNNEAKQFWIVYQVKVERKIPHIRKLNRVQLGLGNPETEELNISLIL